MWMGRRMAGAAQLAREESGGEDSFYAALSAGARR